MKNRDFLNEKSSPDLVAWLDDEHIDFTPTIDTVAGSWDLTPNFKPEEFVCPCGKCAYSTPEGVKGMDYNLRAMDQMLRNKYGRVVITPGGGARCQEYNDSIKGSIKNSKHTQLKANDIYIPGVTNTVKGREEVLALVRLMPGFNYGYHNKDGKYPNMGAAVHFDVK